VRSKREQMATGRPSLWPFLLRDPSSPMEGRGMDDGSRGIANELGGMGQALP
jgi:hypothetical protein